MPLFDLIVEIGDIVFIDLTVRAFKLGGRTPHLG